MKIEITPVERGDVIHHFTLKFSNGLVLVTPGNFGLCPKDARENILRKLRGAIVELKWLGVNVDGEYNTFEGKGL
jgi:hypothetical protein